MSSSIPPITHNAYRTTRPLHRIALRFQTIQRPDRVELSRAARAARQDMEPRHERIAQLRAEIHAGRYETDQRLDAAITAMADDLLTEFDRTD